MPARRGPPATRPIQFGRSGKVCGSSGAACRAPVPAEQVARRPAKGLSLLAPPGQEPLAVLDCLLPAADLDVIRAARLRTQGYDRNDIYDQSPPFGRLCRLCRTPLPLGAPDRDVQVSAHGAPPRCKPDLHRAAARSRASSWRGLGHKHRRAPRRSDRLTGCAQTGRGWRSRVMPCSPTCCRPEGFHRRPVAERIAENVSRRCLAVFPDGQRRLEMSRSIRCWLIEQGIDHGERTTCASARA